MAVEQNKSEVHELKQLTKTQVDKAQQLIDLKHPLYNIKIWQALPYLEPMKKCIPKWCPRTSTESIENVWEEWLNTTESNANESI